MKMEPIVSSETSAIRTQTPGNYPKREQITFRTRRKLKNKKVMKMEPIMSSETSAIRTQTPGNYPKRNKLHLEHGESLKTRKNVLVTSAYRPIISSPSDFTSYPNGLILWVCNVAVPAKFCTNTCIELSMPALP